MKRKMLIFILGSLCFTISQPLLRIPLLTYLQGTSDFILFYTVYPLLTGILIAFSAGLFEESFRYIFKKTFLKPAKSTILEPIIFGLGHGIIEAFYLLMPVVSLVSLGNLKVAFLERFLAIILHVGLTVIVWNGFQLNKRLSYLLLALFIHGSVNSLIPLLSVFDNFIVLIESSLFIIDIFMVFYIYKSRNLYLKRAKL